MKMLRYKIFLSLVLLAGWSTLSFAKENVGNIPKTPVANTHKTTASTCPRTNAEIDLKINNVRARILDGGDLWWDPNDPSTGIYEVPIGSGKNVIYAGSVWIGGIDASGQLKVAAQTYRQSGSNDFWSGPISKDGTGQLNITQNRCNQFDRFWSMDKATVRDFVKTGQIPNSADGKAIQEWPGDGDVTTGELPNLAPYFDANNDGKYNYLDGDYPYFFFGSSYPINPITNNTECNDYLFGDRSIWWVFNDVGNVKTETNSDAIGLEIRAQAFAFQTTDEINDMTFYKYQIINRSNDSLTQTYIGVWCDADLGDGLDDYVGCDVSLGLGYTYNGKPTDAVYGANPPAVGIDFFQGPTADPGDGIDNNHNGVIDELGEDITTSKFVYYINQNGIATGNPAVTDDYYNYLNGEWLDGQIITYGGDGRGAGPGATSIPCNYMFPGKSDVSNPLFTEWTMLTGGIQPADMRFLESAGKFSLAPGAVNYVADGVVFAEATSGGPLASVTLMKSADIAAQKLFKSCFQVKDGPRAPDLAIRELDQQLILSLENIDLTEGFRLFDPNIPGIIPPNGTDTIPVVLTTDQKSYLFEGYKIYQVIDPTVKPSDFENPSKAKLIAQLDLKNNFTLLVNYKKNDLLGGIYVPTQKTEVVNSGIVHTFNIKNDLFRQIPLSNYRPYYFTVIAYAANNFRPFNQAVDNFELNTQAEPYLAGSKNVFVYSGIPHKQNVDNGGTILNSNYGTGIPVTRIEGAGNGGNSLDLTQSSIDEILSSPDHRAFHPQYVGGHSPVIASVYDPMKVKAGNFILAFAGNAPTDHWQLYSNPTDTITGTILTYDALTLEFRITSPTRNLPLVKNVPFTLTGISGITTTPVGVNLNYTFVVDSANNHLETISDTVYFHVPNVTGLSGSNAGALKITIPLKNSSFPIGTETNNDEIYEPSKIRMNVKRTVLEPGIIPISPLTNPTNGFIEGSIIYSDPSKAWLNSVQDNEVANSSQNWIASGPTGAATAAVPDAPTNVAGDPGEVYEGVIGGTWAPFKMTQRQFIGSPKLNTLSLETLSKWSSLASVDVVMTSDKNKWTRATVVEIGEDTMPVVNGGTGGVTKFSRRKQASIDKEGRPYTSGSANSADATLTDTLGMGWFPGYAINIETGERLNIAYGENSALVGENSTDMIFNPSTTIGKDVNGRLSFGGGHYIYVFNKNGTASTDVPIYDNGKKIDSLLAIPGSTVPKRNVFKDCIWTSLPVLKKGHTLLETDVRIRLRVVKDIRQFVSIGQQTIYGAPLYQFGVDGKFTASTNQESVAKSALDNINVVPNPYYAYSSYEKTDIDKLDNRIRIINLPSKCTVSIFTMSGTLVRTYRRDVISDVSDGFAINSGLDNNLSSTLDWDLKNSAGITIASGIYLIHVDAGSIGEKTIKWFGIIRPVDLNTF